MLLPGSCSGHFPHVIEALSVRDPGHVVLDVGIALIPHSADRVGAFVGPLPEAQMVFRGLLDSVAEKNPALVALWDLGAGETEEGLGHVDKAYDAVDRHPRLFRRPEALPFFRNSNDEGAVDSAGIEEALAAGQDTAVVGAIDDNGVLLVSVFLQLREDVSHLGIHSLHGIGVGGIGQPHLGKIWMVGVQLHRGRVGLHLPFLLWKGPALVAVANVADLEEVLPGLALGELALDSPDPPVIPAADVVVRLAAVGDMVAGFLQEVGVVGDPVMRNLVAAAHRLDSKGDRVVPGDPGGAGGSADGRIVETMGVAEAFLCQPVDVGRLCVLAAVAAHPGDAVVLAGDPEDVRAVGSVRGQRHQDKKDSG